VVRGHLPGSELRREAAIDIIGDQGTFGDPQHLPP
jgi:hypothetical protein